MPITKLTIENFKGIRDRVEIPIRPITLLFGANSSGKSTILQALLYMRELLDRQNADADRLMASGASIDLGGFRQFVHGHDLKHVVKIGVTVSVDADGLPVYMRSFSNPYEEENILRNGTLRDVREATVEVDVGWDLDSERPWITGYHVSLNGGKVGSIEAHPERVAEISYFDAGRKVFQKEDDSGKPDDSLGELISQVLVNLDKREGAKPEKHSIPISDHVIPFWGIGIQLDRHDDMSVEAESVALVEFILSQVFVGAGEQVLNELKRIRHIGSFRDIPDRNFNIRRSPSEDRWASGAAAWDLLHTSDLKWFDSNAFENLGLGYTLQQQTYYEIPTDSAIAGFLTIAELEDEVLLTELNNMPIKREVRALQEKKRLQLIEKATGIEVDPSDVGVGVSQVIPVLVGAMAPGYSLLSVEQPELHTHPAVQCALADELAHEVVMSDERCLLLETHSEHLMLRWLRRIRERHDEELPPGAPVIVPEQLSVLYVEATDDGQKITKLPITEDGDFSRQWPNGFFEERAEELF